jgi:hypothetical protein
MPKGALPETIISTSTGLLKTIHFPQFSETGLVYCVGIAEYYPILYIIFQLPAYSATRRESEAARYQRSSIYLVLRPVRRFFAWDLVFIFLADVFLTGWRSGTNAIVSGVILTG